MASPPQQLTAPEVSPRSNGFRLISSTVQHGKLTDTLLSYFLGCVVRSTVLGSSKRVLSHPSAIMCSMARIVDA